MSKSLNTIILVLFTYCSLIADNRMSIGNDYDTYTISGTISEAKADAKVVLSLFDPITQAKTEISSATVDTNGKYNIEYEFTEPDLYRVDIDGKQNVMLVIAKGQSDITLDVAGKSKEDVKILGSACLLYTSPSPRD